MKKITLSMLAALAMSTTAYAAEDETVGQYYIGLAYSDFDASYGSTDVSADGILAIAGYTIDENLAMEGRWTQTSSDLEVDGNDRDKTITNVALYVKAIYPLNDFAIYGLLGFGQTSANNESEEALQYGAGASYNINQNFGLFVDWTRLYDDDGLNYPGDSTDYQIDTWNFGATYRF